MRVFTILLGAFFALSVGASSSFAFETKPFNTKAFEDAQSRGKPILVDVFAPWCPYCKAQHRVLDHLKSNPAYDEIEVFQIDFDHQPDALRALKATKQSTLIAFRGDKETGRAVGITDTQQIEDLLRSTRN
ncbi:thioredoxin (H-type,TRX-H) [Hyphomicrobium denitrificans 1NES1]|uniref:Thioredoxin (H-type,TRX-H) n=1 Tax=Hyphomicrobium denitrificans 1NES1 TaxID=670307 RepID=N0B206_9HYPH|nr:thioredoxin family protein [Hyphomicrobium denitrificans]AGK56973.1 thioredoxin (H-type,TRX-H) [Hyphomicrobium denitrificans 1NES1]